MKIIQKASLAEATRLPTAGIQKESADGAVIPAAQGGGPFSSGEELVTGLSQHYRPDVRNVNYHCYRTNYSPQWLLEAALQQCCIRFVEN